MRKDYSGHGVVQMNSLGPHFYIKTQEGEKPPDEADAMTDLLNGWLDELQTRPWESHPDENAIAHEFIREHTPIVEVSWETVNGQVAYEFEEFSADSSWISQTRLREYDQF